MEKKSKRSSDYMGFLVVCLLLSFAVCVSSIVKFNLFSIICSLMLVSSNSIAIGYTYGKRVANELYGDDNIEATADYKTQIVADIEEETAV